MNVVATLIVVRIGLLALTLYTVLSSTCMGRVSVSYPRTAAHRLDQHSGQTSCPFRKWKHIECKWREGGIGAGSKGMNGFCNSRKSNIISTPQKRLRARYDTVP